ncbi:hypothetical protein BSL78_28947 [Apostichopus japonicus]|uniref:Integrase catalytic domain-containing protein n=1 Tax=Stichopus japonicus TaxID=307972 RepID=A0A2G8JES8_STIJA|nr:hypothetical protein BSL78_28947 [Apostichopus japonicus]
MESIVCKPLYKAPKRLQRMLLPLQIYDVTLGYRPGKQMQQADTLSRAYLPGKPQGHTSREVESVNMVYQLPITDSRKQAIQAHTTSDSTLQTLITIIHNGWPQSKNYLPQCVTPYYQCRDELTVQDGVVIRGERVVVPKTLRREMLDKIHSSHLGIDGCLRRARECLYWPGMNAELKDYIQTCDVCASVGTNQPKEPLMPHAIERRPWSKVGVDLFHVHDRNYVVTVDYFSGFWEIDFLQDTTSNSVIHKLKGQFARHGIPDVCMSDNGPQFSSYEFKQFARD